MLKLVVAGIVTFSCLFAPSQGRTQSFETLLQEFDARDLTFEDKRFLQLALAFEGVYNGLLDGAWGGLSQKALDRYAMNEFGTLSADWHMAMLAFELAERNVQDGWDMHYLSGPRISLLVPSKTLIFDAPSTNFVNMRHHGSSLAISYGVLSQAATENVHDFTLSQSAGIAKPYLVRKDRLSITSVSKADGSTLYTRSDIVGRSWSTVMVSASSFDKNILNAVVASITPGETSSITITPGGKLDRVIQKAIALGNNPKWDDTTVEPGIRSVAQTAPETTPATDKPSEGVVGSGFYVSSDGHVITNAHVVKACQTIMVDGKPADMIDKSDIFDLAILKGESAPAYATFSEAPARLNSDVTAVGFPYGGILGGLNVTRGSVSAMKGFDNNAVEMQITAPVQSGNSGGPLLGADGSVVGVVVSKLDAVQVASVLGDLPQNVNYAVRGELAKLFLSQNGVTPTTSERGAALAPEDLADRAKSYTVFIECDR